MKVEFINPFVNSLTRTFETMLNCQIQRGSLVLKHDTGSSYPISGIIGLSGNAVGTIVLSLSEDVAKQAASVMLMTEMKTIDDDVVDAVGELANMVAGAAKVELEKYELSISLPNVVTGPDHHVRFPSDVTPFCVPFDTDFGPMALEVGFAVVGEEVCV